MVQISHLTAGYEKIPVIQDLSFSIKKETITVIIGPNGSGKSTLAKCVARQIQPIHGEIIVKGKPIHQYSLREYAKVVAYLSQGKSIATISVEELVLHGRYPHLGFPRKLNRNDYEIAHHAMKRTYVDDFKNKMLSELSGGERQRVYIAMALTQEAQLIILDEPTTYLDISYQLQHIELLKCLQQEGKTILTVMHDLNQALQIADCICLMHKGELVYIGSPSELISSNEIGRIFQIKQQSIEVDGKQWLVLNNEHYFQFNK